MTFNKRLLLASGALCFCVASQLFAVSGFEKANEPNFAPGREVRVDVDSEYIGGGHFLVYVPTDYTDKRDWPVIFFYHGMNSEPKTWPFRQITNGRGFIVVGMEYIQRGKGKFSRSQHIKYLKRERRSVLEVKKYLCEHFRIDEKRLFITGNSKGGWYTSALLEISARNWAGAVVLAAGRRKNVNLIASKADKKALKGKPIYIGAGEKDRNRKSAEKAAAYYRKKGADITFEEYKGAGHVFDFTKAKELYNWLITNSAPIRIESARLDKGKSARTLK